MSDVNSINLIPNLIDENLDKNTLIGDFKTDNEASSDESSGSIFKLTESSLYDNDLFTISDNKLYSDEVFNYETKNTYQIEVNYTSNILNSLTSIVTVEINDVNEIFGLSISNNNIDENKEEGSVVGDFITDDEDVLALHNYELVEGFGDSDNNLFKVEDEKLITNVVFDYEDIRKSFTIRVKSTSLPNEYTFENYFIINVNNLPDQIVDLNISSLSVNENQPKRL